MNSENFVAELRAAADDASLTDFVRSICRLTAEAFEAGRLQTDLMNGLECDFGDADVATIHGEMRNLARHDLVDAMNAHIAVDSDRAKIEMLASDMFVHYHLLLKDSDTRAAFLNAMRAMADEEVTSRDGSEPSKPALGIWRETLVKALSDEFRIMIGERK